MGYTTKFTGDLKFTKELTAKQLAHLKALCGEDVRDHAEWGDAKKFTFYYIDFELNDDFSGIRWNGAEKSYDMVGQVDFVVSQMQAVCPGFGLRGEMIAQGEEYDDRWRLVMVNPQEASKHTIEVKGVKACCPECNHNFIVEIK
jgi:hypothetical protein